MRQFQFIALILLSIIGLYSEEFSIDIRLKNGTTGETGKADSVKLILLQGSMVPIAELQNVSGNFSFKKVNLPDNAPVLIQATFSGVNYNKMVPPVREFRTKLQEITVYDVTRNSDTLGTKSLMQIIRGKDNIRIFKVYLITNTSNPPKSFFNPDSMLQVYIPEAAKEILGQLTNANSKMGIPLSLPAGTSPSEKKIDRAFLPGTTEIQISYSIPASDLSAAHFSDKLLIEKDNSRVIFFKPKNMTVDVKGSKGISRLEKGIPEGMGALKIEYPNETKEVNFHISGGEAVEEAATNESRERIITNGTVFTGWDKSLYGVIGFLALLFGLSFVFVYKK